MQQQKLFTEKYLQAQQLTFKLKDETTNLQRIGPRAIDSINKFNDDDIIGGDPEMGDANPVFKSMTRITVLIQQIRDHTYECEKLTNSPIDRKKLSNIESSCIESENILRIFREKLNKRRRDLHANDYLFGSKRAEVYTNLYGQANEDESAPLNGTGGPNGLGGTKYFQQEQEMLSQSLATVQGALNNAFSTIDSLQRQHEILSNIRNKTADIAMQLGFSNNVVTWIQRQENINMIITFVGMLLTIFIVGVFYYWWNRK